MYAFSLWRRHSGPTRSRLWAYAIACFAWGNMKWASLISLFLLFSVPCFVNPPFGDFGDAPGYLAGLRKPDLATEDLGLTKTTRLACDVCQLHIYFQVFNVFNRHGFAGPNAQVGSAGFGQVLPQDLNRFPGPRVGQLGARFTF